jgi:hypothetical protein
MSSVTTTEPLRSMDVGSSDVCIAIDSNQDLSIKATTMNDTLLLLWLLVFCDAAIKAMGQTDA